MGADFLYAVAPTSELNDDRKAQLKSCIAKIPLEVLKEVEDDYCVFHDDEMTEAEMRKTLYEAAVEVCGEESRETSSIQLDGMDWQGVITGGMSWGDSPTDSFEAIAMMYYFEDVWKLLKQFSQEDFRATETG